MEAITRERTESFESVYERFFNPVYRYFVKRLNSKELCEDLTSEVFYSCFVNYDKYDSSKASVTTWIYAVAYNRLKNYYRDRKDTISIEDAHVHDMLFDDVDMEKAVYLSELKTHLETAMETVTQRERTIISLRYYSRLTSDEIAEEVGTTPGNVRVIQTRALKKLAAYFKNHDIRWG